MTSTAKDSIKCKAAVMYEYSKPLVVEEVTIAAPTEDQVRVRLVSAGVCLSEATLWQGHWRAHEGGQQLPLVLGHEAAGVVESVGPSVRTLRPGDHVLSSYVNRCERCRFCTSDLTNLCATQNVFVIGATPNKTLTASGKPVQGFAGIGSFSEYVLLRECQLDRVPQEVKLSSLSAITCGTGSGYGAAKYLARVVPGSSVLVFGAGTFGLNALYGAKRNGATQLIVVDANENRKQLATEFGATEFVNPNKLDGKSVGEYLQQKYPGGVDYVFDCNGDPQSLTEGFKSLTPYGTFVFVALTHSGQRLDVPIGELAFGRKVVGGFFGNRTSAQMYHEVVSLYANGEYDLDKIITHRFTLDQINEAMSSVVDRVGAKTLIVFE